MLYGIRPRVVDCHIGANAAPENPGSAELSASKHRGPSLAYGAEQGKIAGADSDLLSVWRISEGSRSGDMRAPVVCGWLRWLTVLAVGITGAFSAGADEVANFYSGKQVTLIIGYTVGRVMGGACMCNREARGWNPVGEPVYALPGLMVSLPG